MLAPNRIRELIVADTVLRHSFPLFLAGYFILPGSGLHKAFFYTAVLVPFLLTLNAGELRALAGSSIVRWATAYGLYSVLSIAWNPDTSPSEIVKYGVRLFNTAAFLGVVVRLSKADPSVDRMLFSWLCWSAAAGALFSIVWFYSGHDFPRVRLKNCCHLQHAILGASAYGAVAVIAFHRLLDQRLRYRRLGHLLLLMIVLADMLLTQSRGPLLALAAGLGAAAVLRGRIRTIGLIGAIGLGYAALVWFDIVEPARFFTRNQIFSYRLEIWAGTLRAVLTAPWFGHGLNVDETVRLAVGAYAQHPHNAYLASLLYGGVVGGLLLLALCVASLIEAVKRSREDGQTVYLALLVFGLVCMLTDGSQLLTNPRPLWLFFWFPIALLAAGQCNRRTSMAAVSQREQPEPALTSRSRSDIGQPFM